jgi:hypothetical protein
MHNCAYHLAVYEWDPRKARSNRVKHGVAFADAVGALEDPRALTEPDDHDSEARFVTVGLDYLARVVVVAYTWRGASIRIISARKATSGERARYEAES